MEENQLNWVTYGDSVSLCLCLHTPPTMGNPVKNNFVTKVWFQDETKFQFVYFFLMHLGTEMPEPTGPGVMLVIKCACFDIVVCHTDQVKGDMCCISTYDDQRNLVTSN